MPPVRLRKKNSWVSATLTYALLLAGALLTVLPLVFSITTSLRTERDLVLGGALSLPRELTVDNYVRLFTDHDFIVPLAVTLQVVVVMVAGQFFASVLAAYAFARLNFPGRELLFWAYVSTMMIPAIVTMIPLFTMMSQWGLRNTFAGIVLPFMLGSPYAIFLLRQNFKALPQEILDAAELDGAGFWRQLWSIVLPMNRPILVTLLLITVVSQWNNFLWPSIVSPRREWNVLTVATAGLQSQYAANWTLVMAATTLSILPLLVLFVVFNKQIVRSIGISALK
ncbi:carbohydrate ABC transporter permease [Trueperella pecoris]|uniref:Carbohydrate ABC transporter permease n=1 Tax=Trueperella pecoris TaxID=2733571 RepID=A0A7M1QV17_9ACTO|nr:carbohydrate ABC transporter permease [Trueperella pecoris]QOR45706.1 carbohydrate ABC transporter permease [Trueperella pecoris]